MKSTTVRGTPVRSIVAGNEGIAPGVPQNMNGQTVNREFEADHRGYRSDSRSGTPYRSNAGNPGDASRLVVHDARGRVVDTTGTVHNDPASNGSGTIFDGARRANGYSAHPAPTLDSPVVRDAAHFDPSFVPAEDMAHLGDEGGIDDNLVHGGVMGRDD